MRKNNYIPIRYETNGISGVCLMQSNLVDMTFQYCYDAKPNGLCTGTDSMGVKHDTTVDHETNAIRYIDYLLAQAKQYEGTRSGKRTKLLLLASAARLFESIPPRDVRVSDICKGASTSQGTFYLHFQTKNEIAIDLMSRFVDFEIGTMPLFHPGVHPFDNVSKIHNHNAIR